MPPAATEPEHDGIPDFLDRRQPSPPTAPDQEDEKAWLNDVAGAFSGCEDMVSFGEKQRDIMRPMKGKVSADAWAAAQHLAEDHFKRIQSNG